MSKLIDGDGVHNFCPLGLKLRINLSFFNKIKDDTDRIGPFI